MMALALLAENPLAHVVQHPLLTQPAHWGRVFTPKGEITLLSNQIVMMILAGLLLILFVPGMVKRRRGKAGIEGLTPAGPANAIELIALYLRDNVARPNLGAHTDRFIKYIWSIFFFVLTVNLLGLLPVGVISPFFGTHIGGTATGNIYVTGTLALLTLLMMVINGIRLGGRHYFAHFNPGPRWLAPLLVPIEIIGTLFKAIALAVRLFANMLAGHILLAVLLSFILTVGASHGTLAGLAIAIPVVLGSIAVTFLELFVAFLHAFIFTFLTTLFIGQSVVFHHGDEHGDHGAHHPEGAAAH
jgi:F-type H+-transporting ATPase subunit a